MKRISLFLLFILLVGCEKRRTEVEITQVPVGDAFVSCIHKYDEKLNIYYMESQMRVFIPQNVDIKQYRIIDLDGNRHQISEQEWDGYLCTRLENDIKLIPEKTSYRMIPLIRYGVKLPKVAYRKYRHA